MTWQYRLAPRLPELFAGLLEAGFVEAGWVETPPVTLDLRWSAAIPEAGVPPDGDQAHLVVNDPAVHSVLTSKANLLAVTEEARARLSDLGLAVRAPAPRTWGATAADAFRAEVATRPDGRWVRRPTSPGRHAPASLLRPGEDAGPDARSVVQELVVADSRAGTNPLLRLHLLVAGFDPLRAFLHGSGWALPAPNLSSAGQEAAVPPVSTVDAVAVDSYLAGLADDGVDAVALWREIGWALAATLASARDRLVKAMSGAATGVLCLQADVLVGAGLRPVVMACRPWPDGATRGPVFHPRQDPVAPVLLRDVVEVLSRVATSKGGGGPATAPLELPPRFTQILPSPDLVLLALFGDLPRTDVALARAAAADQPAAHPVVNVLVPWRAEHHLLGDHAVVFAEALADVAVLNPTAAYVWLALSDGDDLATAVADLESAFPEQGRVGDDVWWAAADWLRRGLVRPAPLPGGTERGDEPSDDRPSASTTDDRPTVSGPRSRWRWNAGERVYSHLGCRVCVRAPNDGTDQAIRSMLHLLEAPDAETYDSVIEVRWTDEGYQAAVDGGVPLGPFGRLELATAVQRQFLQRAYRAAGVVLGFRAGLAVHRGGSAVLLGLGDAERLGPPAALGDLELELRAHVPLLLRPPAFATRDDATGDLGVKAIVAMENNSGQDTALQPVPAGANLRLLLLDDGDGFREFDRASVARMVDTFRSLSHWRLPVGDAGEAAAALVRLLA